VSSHRNPSEYRPNTLAAVGFASVFFVTACVLTWLGWVLKPSDVAAMDGINLLLFTAIPIPVFAWCSAVVFAVLGTLVLVQSLKREPTLIISTDGIQLANKRLIPIQEVASVEASESALTITLKPKSGTQKGEKLVFSSFALGTSPDKARSVFDFLAGARS
jgi:hypothetical protein